MIAVGQTIGNYTITAKLGEGGMGVVYLAEHPVIGRKVALKAIHPELSRNPEVVSRFMTEAKSVNQIGNEHIVDIHDFGNTSDGEFYFIMEFLQGESLADKLKRERFFPPSRALQVAAQVADALAASHSHGIIHRDLKPENIFLINRGNNVDFVKVLDFGLAKLTQGEEKVTHKTRTGSVMGTPYYMAPEQCEGKASVDHRADLYSLGVILFEMMTGQVPFTGEGYGEIIVKHITVPPPAARSINPQLTAAHEAILMRSLAKNREDRFANMEAFRAAMLDPTGYLAAAPPLPRHSSAAAEKGAVPAPVDDQISGQVVFGGSGSPAPAVRPNHPASSPSTFRHGIGQLVPDEPMVLPKSRKGLVMATLVAAVAAAGAGVYFYSGSRQGPIATDHPPAVPTVPPAPPPVVVPAAPVKTVIKFESTPSGARVIRKDTGQPLGTTPCEASVASGKEAIEFIFQLPNYEDTPARLIPATPTAVLTATMVPQRAAIPEPDASKVTTPAKATAAKSTRPHPTSAAKNKRSGRSAPDEDAVLEPSWAK
jgi:serine/threonine protein kinase